MTAPAPAGPSRMRLLGNFLSLAGAETASKLLTVAAFAYLARICGPEGFGYIEFAGAVLLCAGLIVDQGFGPYGAREIARAPDRTAELVSEIVVARVVLALVAYAAVIAFALSLDRPPVVTRLLCLYGLSLFAMPLLLQWVFQGHDAMQIVATAQVIRQTVFAAAVFAMVRRPAEIWLVAVAELAGVCSVAAYCVWTYRRRFGDAIRLRLRLSSRLFREGVPIGLSQMFWVVRMFGATLILGLIAPPTDVGFFAAALRVFIAIHTFVWLYYFNLLPSLARTWQQGDGSFASLISRSLHGTAWTAVAVGTVWVALAPVVVAGLYGPSFAPAGPVLQWLAAVCAVATLSGHYRFGLIAAGRQTTEMMTTGLGALVALLSIPIGYRAAGPAGTAVGLLAAEIAVWGAAWWCARRLQNLHGHLRLLSRPVVAAALTAVLVRSTPFSPAVQTMIAVGSLVAFALVLDGALRTPLYRQASLLRRQLRQRLGTS